MLELFGRIYELTIGDIGGNALVIDGSQIVFDIKKTGTSTPNVANIKIFNLKSESRNLIKKNQGIILKAGYNSDFGTVFKGTVREIKDVKEVPDRFVLIESKDGYTNLKDTYIRESFAPGTKLKTIIDKIVPKSGLTVGSIRDVPDLSFDGISLDGGFEDVMNSLMNEADLQFNIQDEQLYITKANTKTNRIAIKLDISSGLIDSPVKTEKGWKVMGLMRPGLNPGKIINVVSESFEGFLLIQNSRFDGNSRGVGKDWAVTMETIEDKT